MIVLACSVTSELHSSDIFHSCHLEFLLDLRALLENVLDLSAFLGIGWALMFIHELGRLTCQFFEFFNDHTLDNRELALLEFPKLARHGFYFVL